MVTLLKDTPSISAEIKKGKGPREKVTALNWKNLNLLSHSSSTAAANDASTGLLSAANASQQEVDQQVVEKLWINTYSCQQWNEEDRNALVGFIQSHETIQELEIFLSNGTVKQSPAPTRSFLFALSLIHAAKASSRVKLTLDLYSLSFLDAAHFLTYATNTMSELHVMNLFQQKPTLQAVQRFLQTMDSIIEQQQPSDSRGSMIQMFDPHKPLIVQNLDVAAVKLLAKSVAFFDPSYLQQLQLHIKKLHPGGLKELALFLNKESCPIQTLYLDMDGKMPQGSDRTLLHSVLNDKKLLCNPDHRNPLPVTTVFLQAGKDQCQLVVSPEVLTNNSPYFQVLFSGKFAQTNYIVHLPDCNGLALQALVTFCRYGKDRRLDLPDSTFCDPLRRFQSMAMVAHYSRYLLLSGMLPKVYKLLHDTLKKFPDQAFLALKAFRQYSNHPCHLDPPGGGGGGCCCCCKSIPGVFELLALKHIQYAEVELLRAFSKNHPISDELPEPPTFAGRDNKKVKARYSRGLKMFLEKVEKFTEEGVLDPERDLIAPPTRRGLLTSAHLAAWEKKKETAVTETAGLWSNKQVLLLVLGVLLACAVLGVAFLYYRHPELSSGPLCQHRPCSFDRR